MKVFLAALLFVSTSAIADVRFSTTVIEELKPDVIKDYGDYHLKIFYFNKGTRSEAVHGILLLKTQEIIGRSLEETINTPFGIYVWHGSLDRKKEGWGCTGWLPKKLSTVYPSWGVEKTEQGAAANP